MSSRAAVCGDGPRLPRRRRVFNCAACGWRNVKAMQGVCKNCDEGDDESRTKSTASRGGRDVVCGSLLCRARRRELRGESGPRQDNREPNGEGRGRIGWLGG